jgi:hypothetical protein
MIPLPTMGKSTMKVNVGTVDRVVRVVVGLALIGFAATGTIGAWGYIGIVPLVTGFMRICPAYSLLGINTCDSGTPGGI